MSTEGGESYIKRPRFDNVVSAGTLLQMLTIVISLTVGGVSLYNNMEYQSEKQSDKIDDQTKKLEKMESSISALTAATTLGMKELDSRIRVVEMELPRQSDRIDRLNEEIKRINSELDRSTTYRTQ